MRRHTSARSSERASARRRGESLCGQLQPEDGCDPKQFFKSTKQLKTNQRKARQPCGQVADTLSLVLSGECGDDLLRSLQVVAVNPAPDSTQLLVLVASADRDAPADPRLVLERLQAASGTLRAEVAAAITRRRAPKLLFQVVDATYDREVLP